MNKPHTAAVERSQPIRAYMAAKKGITDDELYNAWVIYRTETKTFKSLGVSRNRQQRSRLKRVLSERCALPTFTPVEIPDTTRPVDELIEMAVTHRERLQANMKAKHNSVLPVHNQDGKPFAIAMLPDQHMDNPGSNLKLIFAHAELIGQTDGLYAIEVGDAIDNFIIGKLEAARRAHLVNIPEAWKLTEHYHRIFCHKLIAAISGNHLEWTTRLGGVDYLASVMNKAGVQALYDADELYFSVQADNGRMWKYGLRHFFQGASLFNAAHSVARYAMSHAYRGEDVVVAGHKHVAGYQVIESHGKVVHCIQTGSYKDRDLDDYCRTKGFMSQHAFLCPVVIHFPETGKSHFIPEIEEAIPYLRYLRSKK